MAATHLDDVERARISDLLDELGPDAPTLLRPWTTRDLVAHLVLREHDPLAGPGLVIPGPWARLAERRRRSLARTDFSRLVATLRSGPPPGFFRLGWVRRIANLNELYVHHEDVRRANGHGPRTDGRRMDDALWRNVGTAPWFLTRRLRGVGLVIERADTAETVRTRPAQPAVRLVGQPGELLLFLFGRQDAAHVALDGPATAVAAVRQTRLGI